MAGCESRLRIASGPGEALGSMTRIGARARPQRYCHGVSIQRRSVGVQFSIGAVLFTPLLAVGTGIPLLTATLRAILVSAVLTVATQALLAADRHHKEHQAASSSQ